MTLLMNPAFLGAATSAAGWDFEDDFSGSTNWSEKGTKYTITGGAMDWELTRDTTIEGEVHDFGSTISDTAWISRVKIIGNNDESIQATPSSVYHGMSSISTGASETAQDFIGWGAHLVTAANTRFELHDYDGVILTTLGDDNSGTNVITNTTWFAQTRRLTATTTDLKIYSDAYSTLVDTMTATVDSTIVSLQYAVMHGRNKSSGTNSVLTGTFDDYFFLDASTSPP